jgi:hypothetical protein
MECGMRMISGSTLLLLAVGIVSPPVALAQTANVQSLSVEVGIDYVGGDYRSFAPARPDANECRTACAGEAWCQAYTFRRPTPGSPNGSCHLKSAPSGRKNHPCCISGRRYTEAEAGQLPYDEFRPSGAAPPAAAPGILGALRPGQFAAPGIFGGPGGQGQAPGGGSGQAQAQAQPYDEFREQNTAPPVQPPRPSATPPSLTLPGVLGPLLRPGIPGAPGQPSAPPVAAPAAPPPAPSPGQGGDIPPVPPVAAPAPPALSPVPLPAPPLPPTMAAPGQPQLLPPPVAAPAEPPPVAAPVAPPAPPTMAAPGQLAAPSPVPPVAAAPPPVLPPPVPPVAAPAPAPPPTMAAPGQLSTDIGPPGDNVVDVPLPEIPLPDPGLDRPLVGELIFDFDFDRPILAAPEGFPARNLVCDYICSQHKIRTPIMHVGWPIDEAAEDDAFRLDISGTPSGFEQGVYFSASFGSRLNDIGASPALRQLRERSNAPPPGQFRKLGDKSTYINGERFTFAKIEGFQPTAAYWLRLLRRTDDGWRPEAFNVCTIPVCPADFVR